MFRDILSGSRAIFIGLVFFVLVVGGSLLYSWHVHRTTDAEVAETQRKVQPLENKNETRTAADTVDTSTMDVDPAETPLEDNETQPMFDDTAAVPIDDAKINDLTDAFLSDDFVSEEASTEDVPVSPFGFGPYPVVPVGFPADLMPAWLWSKEKQEGYGLDMKDFELMSRVLIKLWNQGTRNFNGVSKSDKTGLIYPSYPDTVYVTYSSVTAPDGKTYQYVSHIKSGLSRKLTSQEQNQLDKGETPAGIRVLDIATDGIDPYTFLNLQ